MHILILCDDEYHPAKNLRKGLGWLESVSFQPYWVENAEDWHAGKMSAYPLVILSKSNQMSADDDNPWMTKGTQTAFVNYVRQGGGLLAIHSGIAGYEECTLFRRLLGGVLTHHPSAR